MGLLGGKSKEKAAQKQANQQYKNDMAAMELQRKWDIEDRDEARAYNRVELDEARTYSRQVYSHLVEDAEAAGFNPLTALRNGGGSGYGAGSGMAPLSSTPLSRKAPVKQAVGGSAVGDALTGVGDFISNFDPFADQKKEQEYRLVESQISALNASALSGAPRGAASFAQGDVERRPSGQAAALGKPTPFKANDVNVTNPWGSFGGEVAPWAADGASFEDRYGEFGGSALGLVVGGADLFHNAKRAIPGSWMEPLPKDHVVMRAARWIDGVFGTEKTNKALPSRFTGGGGGW